MPIGQGGNYELWVQNPIAHVPVAHNIWDPHFSSTQLHTLSANNSYSSMYNQLYSIGLINISQLYNLQLTFEL